MLRGGEGGPRVPPSLSQPTHQSHAQEGHARVRKLVVPQYQGHQPLPLLLEALTDVGQTWGRPVGKPRLRSWHFPRGHQCGSHGHPMGTQNLPSSILTLAWLAPQALALPPPAAVLLPWPNCPGPWVSGTHPSASDLCSHITLSRNNPQQPTLSSQLSPS